MKNTVFLAIGTFFGIVMYKTEAASWFRIYEMFTFESFHMYGLIGTALFAGIAIVQVIKRRKLKHIEGHEIMFAPKERSFSRYMFGGIIFGLGWALAGACPGPMFVLLGAGNLSLLLVIGGAVAGTYAYGLVRKKLPH